jgi:hypothetical protein
MMDNPTGGASPLPPPSSESPENWGGKGRILMSKSSKWFIFYYFLWGDNGEVKDCREKIEWSR